MAINIELNKQIMKYLFSKAYTSIKSNNIYSKILKLKNVHDTLLSQKKVSEGWLYIFTIDFFMKKLEYI